MSDYRNLLLPLMVAICLPAIAFTLMGVMPLMVFLLAFGGGLVFYAATLWRTPIDTTKILVPYLLTVIFFIIHVYEEYLTDFEDVASTIGGRTISEENFMTIAGFLAPIMWVAGAIFILKRWKFGDYFLCMFFFAMLIAELTHFIFPFLIDGTFHYESGMYTAAIPLIPAAYGLRLMFKEIRQDPAHST